MSRVGGISDVYEDPQTFTGDANLDTLFDEYHITLLPNIMPRQRKKNIEEKIENKDLLIAVGGLRSWTSIRFWGNI